MFTLHPEADTPATGKEDELADIAMDAIDAVLGAYGIALSQDDWERMHRMISAHLAEAVVYKLHRNNQ